MEIKLLVASVCLIVYVYVCVYFQALLLTYNLHFCSGLVWSERWILPVLDIGLCVCNHRPYADNLEDPVDRLLI